MTLVEATTWALLHFKAMDEANAAIHCANVRYSPITFRLAEALHLYGDANAECVVTVMAHKARYEEDKGR